MVNETWKSIPVFEGLYEVSDAGRVRSIARTVQGSNRKLNFKSVILKMAASGPMKYRQVILSKNGRLHTKRVHRLVALAFHANPEGKSSVNHKDGNTANNTVSNLEWVTTSENLKWSYKHLGRRSVNFGKVGIPGSKAVHCPELNKTFVSARQAEETLGITSGKVSAVCRGERNRANNLTFQFV